MKRNCGEANSANIQPATHRRFYGVRRESGQAIVETALILPVLVALLLGGFELGRIAFAAIEVENAARAGVAYASENPVNPFLTANIQTAAQQEAPDVTITYPTSPAWWSLTCKCSNGTAVTCATSAAICVAPAFKVDTLTLNVQGTVTSLFGIPGIPSTVTLNGAATMRVNQE